MIKSQNSIDTAQKILNVQSVEIDKISTKILINYKTPFNNSKIGLEASNYDLDLHDYSSNKSTTKLLGKNNISMLTMPNLEDIKYNINKAKIIEN